MRPDRTWGVNVGAGLEIAGLGLGIDADLGLSFNNRLGVATELGITPSLSISQHAGDAKTAGLNFALGLSMNSRSGTTITPSIGLSFKNTDSKLGGSLTASLGYKSRVGMQKLNVSAEAHTLSENMKKETDAK